MIDLNYSVYGNGHPLVFIHGGGTDSRMWEDIASKMPEEYQVITYDLRGHGESPIPTDTTHHIKDLRQLFDYLQIEKATIVGHSLGGQIATDFSILIPEKVRKLVLIAPGLTGFKFDEKYQKMGRKIWGAVPDVDAMLKIMLNTPDAYAMHKSMRSKKAGEIEQIHRDNIIKSLQWKNFEQDWPLSHTVERLEELSAPVLFLTGSDDKKDIFKIRDLFHSVPDISFREIEGADHGLIATNVKEISKAIIQFIDAEN
ncbi:alpha/beta fold hydrolase [Balneola sp. MJW-20]|uniref:alpha/beta fold hydrolase n=1 Tax=Gracilimonas aurantiaca TaxID=3234185 RepID=UPI00390AE398